MKRFLILFLSILLLLSSCTSTKPFVEDVTLSDSIPLEEKFEYYGGKEVYVDEPEMFFNGTEWLERLTEEVEKAEDYILLYSYLSSSVPDLENFFSLLAKKAEEGVRVYLAFDGTSNLDMTETKKYMSPLFSLRESGVNLLVYAPVSFSHVINPSQLLIRDHRKMIVIDGKVSVLGGMNLNYISIGAGDENQRDSMYLFHSSDLTSKIIDSFVSLWNEGSVEQIDTSSFAVHGEEGEYRAWLFDRDVYKGDVSISGMYGSLINEAEESVFFCPYLPSVDQKMIKSIRKCVGRGVDFTMYCSQDPRQYLVSGMAWGNAVLIENTGARYIDVTSDENGDAYPLFHMKVMIVDNRYLVIGSTNFNFRSMALSHEIALVIDSPEIAEKVEEGVRGELGCPRELTLEELLEKKDEYGSFLGYLIVFFGG